MAVPPKCAVMSIATTTAASTSAAATTAATTAATAAAAVATSAVGYDEHIRSATRYQHGQHEPNFIRHGAYRQPRTDTRDRKQPPKSHQHIK